jgi:hypothetical protein
MVHKNLSILDQFIELDIDETLLFLKISESPVNSTTEHRCFRYGVMMSINNAPASYQIVGETNEATNLVVTMVHRCIYTAQRELEL